MTDKYKTKYKAKKEKLYEVTPMPHCKAANAGKSIDDLCV
jgi:hypothetical protein